MGKRAETRDELRKESVTKIHGQPKDQDITTLEKELIAIAASIPTTLGGGNHGHAGLIVDATKYLTMTGVAFAIPPNPGIYPAGLAANAAAGIRARAEAEHKEEVAQYEILKGVEQALKDIILEAVENDYLMEIEDETLGYLNQTPRQMIDHLKARGGSLDFADTKTLLAERDMEWDLSENPQVYFNRVEKAVKALTRAGITSDMNERRDMALYYLKASGEFDAAVREWENKTTADKTWINIKTFIATEYARENKQNKLTAKQFRANLIEDQAEATEELIATLTENHTRQMEALIKSTSDAMKEMMQLVKSNTNTQKNPNKLSDDEKKKKGEERRKKYNEAPICTHCGRKHPTKKEEDCWELEKNKASRPSYWKSKKST
jgi:hypothetical protein